MLVYSRDADGDAKPVRTIQGDKTKLLQIVGISRRSGARPAGGLDLLAPGRRRHRSARSSSGPTSGNVAPQRVIAGPKTGITRLRQIGLDPATGRIFVAAINNEYLPPYNIDKPREGLPPDVDLPSPWNTGSEGFIGVWNDEGDDGDVPPHSIIKGRSTGIVHPAGVTFNARTAR